MKHEVVGLQLPILNMSSLQVIYEDHRTYASQASVSFIFILWSMYILLPIIIFLGCILHCEQHN